MSVMKKVSYIESSIRGIGKGENQDNILILENENGYLFVVFDGVGSAINSAEATRLAKEFISNVWNDFFKGPDLKLAWLMASTNSYLVSYPKKELLTTYSAVYIPKSEPKIILYSSLGDSRIYVVNPQYLEQISEDDKLSANSNYITKCLGLEHLQPDDFKQNRLNLYDDKLLLCTDGFYHILEANLLDFFFTLIKTNPSSIRRSLNAKLIGNNDDDATYLLIQ
ncbi:serine/threonine protein phosphatase PrpC [Pontibacter virosus]|uniref:Serine/threonine protein phosphatase PrpC n=2 Tax=Pontibacter virosus TaxID=1765052 RepID=A0A2U1AVG1_9BACT|nr:serine/threonine protein phosphatase PrpC [Pontibacter virosus]